ncbi:MAG: hypothetical protein PWQ48_1110 [Thermotogaceae bacterium]|jgi:hypothetical protein|nr:hypothetical protein [Thermotogaceae bacterium]
MTTNQNGENKIPKLNTKELILVFFETLSARCWARLGLIPDEYGEMKQDLDEARLAIDVLDKIIEGMDGKIEEKILKEMRGVVSNLKLNYVNQYEKSQKRSED